MLLDNVILLTLSSLFYLTYLGLNRFHPEDMERYLMRTCTPKYYVMFWCKVLLYSALTYNAQFLVMEMLRIMGLRAARS